jgi:pyrroloquinoline quinone (PQQ) biosynthesis protein C
VKSVEQLLDGIGSHPAVNNEFYAFWTSRSLSIEQLAIFARNYGEWVRAFPDSLALLLISADDLVAKTEYVKTLYSEMGYGNVSKVHSRLLNGFFCELACRMNHEGRLDWDRLRAEGDCLPCTRRLVEGEQDLYRDKRLSFGAQLGLEWQAYTMLRKLYDGARNYLPLWAKPDEFHEACEYFYAHIGATEKEHKVESLAAARRYSTDEESLASIIDGYHRHLNLIQDFWRGLHEAIMNAQAPAGSPNLTAAISS